MSENSTQLLRLLGDCELTNYYGLLVNKLKVQQPVHLKFVTSEDLSEIGMTKPEQRRLLKCFRKQHPDTYVGKLRQKVLKRVPSWKGSRENLAGGSSVSMDSPRSHRGSCSSIADSAAVASSNKEQHIIPANCITLCKELGEGEFGMVYQGVWATQPNGSKVQVAVKCVAEDKLRSNPLDFLQEASIMHRVSHENIVKLYGVVLEMKRIMLVKVSELAPLRSLLECLREEALRPSFPVLRLCEYALQICSGMAYLESQRMIHRDLAARNILVFSADKVKISDFGLSRALGIGEEYYRSNFSVNLKLPIAWCSPESMNFLKFTSASDCWSFGVTLWEMFTYGFQPWVGMTGQQILEAIDAPRCQRLEIPDACPQEYYGVMLQCWEHEPQNRPKFAEILTVLPEIKPQRLQTITECQDGQLDHLQFKAGDVVTVLNQRPKEYPDGYYWKGVLPSGRTGLFVPSNTVTYLGSDLPGFCGSQLNLSNSAHQTTQGSTANTQSQSTVTGPFGSFRSSFGKKGKLSSSMISAPQNDLRHTGHIGKNGEAFGSITDFVVDSQHTVASHRAKLPKQIVSPFKIHSPKSAPAAATTAPTNPVPDVSNQNRPPDAVSNGPSSPPALPPKPPRASQRMRALASKFSSKQTTPDGHERLCSTTSSKDSSAVTMVTGMGGQRGTLSVATEETYVPDLDSVDFENCPVDLGPSMFDEVFEVLKSGRKGYHDQSEKCTDDVIMSGRNDIIMKTDLEYQRLGLGMEIVDVKDTRLLLENTKEADKSSSCNSSARHTPVTYKKVHGLSDKKQALVKPLSSSDAKLLAEAQEQAQKLAAKALDEENARCRAQIESLLAQSIGGNSESTRSSSPEGSGAQLAVRQISNSGSSDNNSMTASPKGLSRRIRKWKVSRQSSTESERKSFSENLQEHLDTSTGLSSLVTPNAEKAYAALVESKTEESFLSPPEGELDVRRSTAPNIMTASCPPAGLQNDQAPQSSESEEDELEEEVNPLRALRQGAGGLSFRGAKSTSGGRAQAIKATPLLPPKTTATVAHRQGNPRQPERMSALHVSVEPQVSPHHYAVSQKTHEADRAPVTRSPPPPIPPKPSSWKDKTSPKSKEQTASPDKRPVPKPRSHHATPVLASQSQKPSTPLQRISCSEDLVKPSVSIGSLVEELEEIINL